MSPGRRATLDTLARRVYRRLPLGAQERVRGAREKILSERSSGLALSVIMPVYNVRVYLDEAVRSVLTQDFEDLELILVDDGSTDVSGQMCDDWAAKDPRVRVIHKVNDGLGAARNTGIAAARGEFLVFIDSDDYVPPGVYGRMVATLRRTGSDIVSGNVQRLHGSRIYLAWNQSRTHSANRYQVTLADDPNLVYDTVSWNKVYRASFFREHVQGFPEHKLYEDMHPVFRAYAAARSIDILAEPVYVWRRRDEGDSITQRLLETQNLADRMEMLAALEATAVAEGVQDSVGPVLLYKILEGDLWIYVSTFFSRGTDDPEFVDLLVRTVQRYWPGADEESRTMLQPERCVTFALLAEGRVEDARTFLTWFWTINRNPTIVRTGDDVRLDLADSPVELPPLRTGDLDATSLALTEAVLTYGRWLDGTTIRLDGYAYVRFVTRGGQRITLVATDTATGRTHEWDTTPTDSPDATARAWDSADDHGHDGFTVDVDVTALRDGRSSAAWEFSVRITDGDLTRTAPLTNLWHTGSLSVFASRLVAPGVLALVRTARPHPFTVEFEPTPVALTELAADGAEVRMRLADDAPAATGLWLAQRGGGGQIALKRDADGVYRGRVPVAVPSGSVSWRVMSDAGARPATVLAPAEGVEAARPDADGVQAEVNRAGRAIVRVYAPTAIVDELAVRDDAVHLSGHLLGATGGEFGLAPADSVPTRWHAATTEAGRYTTELPLTATGVDGVQRPIPSGNLHVYFRPPGGASSEVLVSDERATTLPLRELSERLTAVVARRGGAGLRVEVSSPLQPADRGTYAERTAAETYGVPERTITDSVLFYVNIGAGASDSALAIHRELQRRDAGLELLWGVNDLSVPVPEGGRPVLRYSHEWYEKVNTSRYIVNNYGGIMGLTKHPDQRYLQTWHGTPYKFIGASEMRTRPDAAARLEAAAREAAEWDAFVSPNPFVSGLVEPEFLFTGRVLETGYPRNDALAVATDADRAAIRDTLGIDRDAKVLLYAPTYREQQRNGWKAQLFEGLDLAALVRRLGPGWTVILRGHSFIARGDHSDRTAGQIVDATRHPDINDLYLASDVLLTDYSSAMFDYAVTGRPILLFTPDLEQYVASRGVYFDLAEVAPTPLFTEQEPLADALADLDAFAATHAERYAAFRERFTPWDDGHAAARVVDAFFTGTD